MGVIVKSQDGTPILFAAVPNSGVTKINTQQQSGNTSYDARSGKFAAKGAKAEKPSAPPNTDPNEYARMYAAVRELARELGTIDDDTVKEFLGSRASNPDQVDLAAFVSMVKQQRVNDLVDVFNNQLKIKDGAAPGANLTAEPGWVKASVAGLEPSQVEQLVNVLVSLGNQEKDVRALFTKAGENNVTLSDAISFEPPPPPLTRLELADAIAEAIAKMPTPEIIVNIPEPKPKTITMVRDAKGLVQTMEGL